MCIPVLSSEGTQFQMSGIPAVCVLFLIFVTEKIVIPVSVHLHAFTF